MTTLDTATTAVIVAVWNSLTLEEREIVAYDVPEEDCPVKAWRKILSLGLRDAKSGDLTPLGKRMREEWEKAQRPLP